MYPGGADSPRSPVSMDEDERAPTAERTELMTEIARFQDWASAYPPEQRRGEWECDYGPWDRLWAAVLAFVDRHPFAEWSAGEVRAVLYAIARDNENQHIAREIRERHPELLLPLTGAAIAGDEQDARWQLAVELGHHGVSDGETERALLTLAGDDHEYVRRQALAALARLGSPAVEELALAAWNRPDPAQEWARMMVLWCLHKRGSPLLASLLAEAERDEREHLRGYAERVKRGEVDP